MRGQLCPEKFFGTARIFRFTNRDGDLILKVFGGVAMMNSQVSFRAPRHRSDTKVSLVMMLIAAAGVSFATALIVTGYTLPELRYLLHF